MKLVDRIKNKVNAMSYTDLSYNKEILDFIDNVFIHHGTEICKAIGEVIVNSFCNSPGANNIEIRCFSPIHDKDYPLGKMMPKRFGSIWCSNLRRDNDKICYVQGNPDGFNFLLDNCILHEISKYQPNVEKTTVYLEEYGLFGQTTSRIELPGYSGKYIKTRSGVSIDIIEQSPTGPLIPADSTENLVKYKLFQMLNDYILPYLEKEGFIITREIHNEYKRDNICKGDLISKFLNKTSYYYPYQFIYITLP